MSTDDGNMRHFNLQICKLLDEIKQKWDDCKNAEEIEILNQYAQLFGWGCSFIISEYPRPKHHIKASGNISSHRFSQPSASQATQHNLFKTHGAEVNRIKLIY